MELLAFPLEIRLMIYEEALVHCCAINGLRGDILERDRLCLCPAILRTSKWVYSEALPALYSKNRFLVDWISRGGDSESFLRQYCFRHHASLVRCVQVRMLPRGGSDFDIKFAPMWQKLPAITTVVLSPDSFAGPWRLAALKLECNNAFVDITTRRLDKFKEWLDSFSGLRSVTVHMTGADPYLDTPTDGPVDSLPLRGQYLIQQYRKHGWHVVPRRPGEPNVSN